MAGQAHYTSAPPGVSGRYGGFRFTAVSPAARPALEMLRPLTAGTAPPGAEGPATSPPSSPTTGPPRTGRCGP